MNRVTPLGSPISGPSVVNGAKWSIHTYHSQTFRVPSSVFIRGQENVPFTLEARAALTRDNSDSNTLLSHNGAYDGLFFTSDNKIHFKIEFETAGSVDISYYGDTIRRARTYHAVYNVSSIQLYVDAELVAEADITEAQRDDGFKTRASSDLYVGQSSLGTNTREMDVGYLAIYNRALENDRIWVHWHYASEDAGYQAVSTTYGAVDLIGRRDVHLKSEWSGSDWYGEELDNVAVDEDGRLVPELDSADTSVAGTWEASMDLDSADGNIYGVLVEWDGRGSYTVETSINEGSSWSTATNGRYATGTFNLDGTDIRLAIRISFAGSIANDTSAVDWIRVTSFKDANVYTADSNRTVVVEEFNAVMNPNVYETMMSRHAHQGLRSYSASNGFYLTADSDPDTTFSIKAFECWVWMNSTGNNIIFDNTPNAGSAYVRTSGSNTYIFSGGTLYINGTSVSSGTYGAVPGRFVHCLFVLTTSSNVRFEVASPSVNMPFAKIYSTAPTDPVLLFETHSLKNSALFASETLSISEPATPFKLYAYDWTTASGR